MVLAVVSVIHRAGSVETARQRIERLVGDGGQEEIARSAYLVSNRIYNAVVLVYLRVIILPSRFSIRIANHRKPSRSFRYERLGAVGTFTLIE